MVFLSGFAIALTDLASSNVAADSSTYANVSVGVDAACTLSSSNNERNAAVIPGDYHENVGGATTFMIGCNDPDGYVVYAVGNSNNKEGNTAMIGAGAGKNSDIETGVATNGDTSNWAFKIHSASSNVIVQEPYDDYAAIPTDRTAIVKRESITGVADTDSFSVSYAVYVSGTQVVDTYSGKVKYILFQPSTHGPEDDGIMQNWTGCDDLEEDEIVNLEDTRDGDRYNVSKLKDGRCWMVENLRLGGEEPIDLTPDDSDVSTGFTLPARTDAYEAGKWDVPYVHMGNEMGHTEMYYSWPAATAGTGKTSMGDGENATDSICPIGWKLPTREEIIEMAYKYGTWPDTDSWSDALRASPSPNFTLTGKYNLNGADTEVGIKGYWWSSTAWGSDGTGNSNSYTMQLDISGEQAVVGAGTWFNQYQGFSVRCIAK